MKKNFLLICFLALFAVQLHAETVLRLSTTTSTADSGLLPVLNAPFEKQHNVRIDVIAVGTGKALRLGENGDVDVVFVHAPQAEEEFVKAGFGVDRQAVMHNDFVLAGPKSDPAGVKNAASPQQALQKIAAAGAAFISRGDDSGTHKKEQELWTAAGIKPQGAWYVSAGQGMGAVLRMADDKQAYTLADRGTFISYQGKIELAILNEGDPALFNPYHILAVNPQRYPHVQYPLAKQYIDYVTGAEGQTLIGNYKMSGQQLFFPDAEKISAPW
jgi:tungstate transport system substrate-binding protein